MKPWDFMNILWNDLHLEFRVTSIDSGAAVYVASVSVDDMAEYITDIQKRAGLTPSLIDENSNEFELGYSFND